MSVSHLGSRRSIALSTCASGDISLCSRYRISVYDLNTMFSWTIVLALCVTGTRVSAQTCPSVTIETKERDVRGIRTLDIETDGIFTWNIQRGTRNVTIEHSSLLNVDISYQSNGTLGLSMFSSVETTTAEMTSATHGSTPNTTIQARSSCDQLSSRDSVTMAVVLAALSTISKGRVLVVLLPMSLASLMVTTGLSQELDCEIPSPSTHLFVPPSLVEEICVNGNCWPVLCKLNPFSPYSNVPSNNRLAFSDNNCTIRAPIDWEAWVEHYFGSGSTQGYLGDFDGDGLVNILEYYGNDLYNETLWPAANATSHKTSERRKRDAYSPLYSSTNPRMSDSDGDRLQDGFEIQFSMSATEPDDFEADDDGDGISNLEEQIQGTDPLNVDTDGDGVSDGDEIDNGANPRDTSDDGIRRLEEAFAEVNLTVGDHSGSHSERYVLYVGGIAHQSPGFGLVGSGVYTYRPGTYDITIHHAGSIRTTPDYDYYASVTKKSGEAGVAVSDPDGMLGSHHESSYFYAAGKSATMTVNDVCRDDDKECRCSRLRTCIRCKEGGCIWVVGTKHCLYRYNGRGNVVGGESDTCPCEICQSWYNIEMRFITRTDWLGDFNRQYPCPCRVTIGETELRPQGDTGQVEWLVDNFCMVEGDPQCSQTNPEAFGCIVTSQSDYPRQQCCYDISGNLLPGTHRGVGTARRPGDTSGTRALYTRCCKECEESDSCQRYIELRKADGSHCTK